MIFYNFIFINGSGIVSFITDLLYKANLNTGSVLEYALAFTSAALDKYCSKWSAAPKTGFIDITISKDFYRIYSGLQIVSSNPLQLLHLIIYTIMSKGIHQLQNSSLFGFMCKPKINLNHFVRFDLVQFINEFASVLFFLFYLLIFY
jgi:hypothetical protein